MKTKTSEPRQKTGNRTLRHFFVTETFAVPLEKGRLINGKTCCDAFFDGEAAKYKDRKGCYVFSLRNGGGVTPYYVGKTKRTFGKEAFTPRNISHHYQLAIAHHQGTPVMTFVVLETARGKVPDSTIQEVEKHLIQVAYAKNPNLSNTQNLPKDRWVIDEVMNASRGQPAKRISEFRSMMGM